VVSIVPVAELERFELVLLALLLDLEVVLLELERLEGSSPGELESELVL
jgi:hypothetical protein